MELDHDGMLLCGLAVGADGDPVGEPIATGGWERPDLGSGVGERGRREGGAFRCPRSGDEVHVVDRQRRKWVAAWAPAKLGSGVIRGERPTR